MASLTLSDEQLAKEYGYRKPKGAIPLFEPSEFGYKCPQGHGGDKLTWSEFNDHLWCYQCQKDYHYASDCTIQRPSWMTPKQFREFLARLPIKPKLIAGVDRWLESIDKQTTLK